MAWKACRTSPLCGAGRIAVTAVLWSSMAWAQEQIPTFSLKAVKRNGVAITPSNSVGAMPGDTIEAEIFLSEWSPQSQRLAGWQVLVGTTSGFTSGAGGSFDFIPAPRACTNDDGCDDIGGTCSGGFCSSNPPTILVPLERGSTRIDRTLSTMMK